MPDATETWTEDDGVEWGVYALTCDACGCLICITAPVAAWDADLTEFQQDRIREDGTALCTTCATAPEVN